MCEVKGGCTCGNEYCQDDFDVAALAPKHLQMDVIETAIGRNIYSIDIGDLGLDEVAKYVDKIATAFKK